MYPLLNIPKPVTDLSEAEARKELAQLAGEVEHHRKLYYQKDAPEISDAAFDALVQRNEAIEKRFPKLKREDSPTEKVGAAPAAGFAIVKRGPRRRHKKAMQGAARPRKLVRGLGAIA